MKSIVLLLVAASAATAMPANATVTVTTSALGVIAPGDVVFANFDTTGLNSLSGNIAIVNGTTSDHAALPGNTSNYGVVPANGSSGYGEVSYAGTKPIKSFSLDWGSVDKYNTLTLFDKSHNVFFTYLGSMLPPSNGDQFSAASNPRVTFTFNTPQSFGGFGAKSDGKAFEFDNASTGAVPEPASWAMMIAGFGVVGAAARRRRVAMSVIAA